MGKQHEGVREVDDRGLGRTGEHLARVGHEPLVELIGSGHQHGQRTLRRAPGTARLLAQRRHGAGEPVDDTGVEPADVDAELERGRGDDPGELTVEQLV